MYKWLRLGIKKLGYLYTQVVGGDLTRNSTAIYPYGLKGNAPKNSLVLLLNIDGSIEKTINIELSNMKNAALKEGELLMGNFVMNNIIKFDENGNIIIKGDKIIIEGPIETTGSLKVGSEIKAGGEIINGNDVTLGNHIHQFPYNAGPVPSTGATEPGQG